MRSAGLISWCASAALAKEFTIFPAPGAGECRPDSLLRGYLGESECAGSNVTGNVVAASTLSTVSSGWPIASPCSGNGTHEFCVYANPSFAGGRGIVVLTSPDRAAELAKSAPFTDPSIIEALPHINEAESPKWHVAAVPGKGMGLIATQRFQVGDHIMTTTPAVMIDYNTFYALPDEQLRAMQGEGMRYLPPRHRGMFMNLSTHDGAVEYLDQVAKIINTNAFDIEDTGIVLAEEDEIENWYTVFPEISRMNHDCRGNADYHFDPATLTQNINAVREILPGEEITISYIDPVQTKRKRSAIIERNWHFPCSCSACTQSREQVAASDARVRQIVELREQLRDYSPGSQATPQMGELLVSLFEQERLWGGIYEAYTYAAIEHNGAGEAWLASKYARLAVQRGIAAAGVADSDVVEMRSLARDPRGHWSWMLRTTKKAEGLEERLA